MMSIFNCILFLCVCKEYSAAINWQPGNWANGCDFYGNGIPGSVYSAPEKCGGICANRPECSHFTWAPYTERNGKCYLKTGRIDINTQAKETADKRFICGFNSRAISSVPQAPSKNVTISLWEHTGFQGKKYSFSLKANQCLNLYNFNDKASSINTNHACVYIYEHANCQGEWDQVSPASFSHDNLNGIGFNDKMTSIIFCSDDSNNVAPSKWVPKFHFDGKAQCYPAHPSTNGLCLGIERNAPVYYEGKQCGSKYRLQYWLFYGWQKSCTRTGTPIDGLSMHDNDWEHVTVNFRNCDGTWCISSVTFSQHNGWYTRKYMGKRSLNTYVGKIAHGNYFNTCCAKKWCASSCTEFPAFECRYFGDFRNPGETWIPHNLSSIDAAASINQKIRDHGNRNSCELAPCKSNGCTDNESDI